MIRQYYIFGCLLLALFPYHSARADLFDFTLKNQPLSIEADSGVEIRQQEKIYVARGNVKIMRGTLELQADTVTAYYRDKKEGKGLEIWKIYAQGNVELVSEADQVSSSEATIDFDRSSFILQSQNGQIISIKLGDHILTALGKIEYVDEIHQMTALGKPTLSNKPMNLSLAGDEIKIFLLPFKSSSSGEMPRIQKLTADHQVRLQQKDTIALADRLVYTVQEKTILMSGHAQITQGNNQIQGENMLINLASESISITATPGSSQKVNTLLLLDPINK